MTNPIYGENLYGIYNGKTTASNAVQAWINEGFQYSTTNSSLIYNHFTQVVWKNTIEV